MALCLVDMIHTGLMVLIKELMINGRIQDLEGGNIIFRGMKYHVQINFSGLAVRLKDGYLIVMEKLITEMFQALVSGRGRVLSTDIRPGL